MTPGLPGASGTAVPCLKCGTAVAPGLLRCPACGALVFAVQLQRLAQAAENATSEGRLAEATHAWQEALHLLPADAGQRATIEERLQGIGARMERGEGRPAKTTGAKRGVWAGIVGAAALILSKAKLILLGFTKAGALLSLVAFLGIYWREWGWAFAAGMVVSIYLHELGHVFALSRYGIPVSAPMFVPGFGAFVRHGHLPTSRIGARVAIAGPAAGLVAAALALALFELTGNRYWSAVAYLGALINVANLIPVWLLDGVRVVAPMNGTERGVVVAALIAMTVIARNPFLLLASLGVLVALFFTSRPGPGDRGALAWTVTTIIGLGAIAAWTA